MTDARPLPRTTDDPRWPAFRAWADVHLPNAMLGAYWECWKAAHAEGRRIVVDGRSCGPPTEIRRPSND